MIDTEGPFLQAALICDRVLQEQDGTLSAIRIIDRVLRLVGDPDSDLEPFQQQIWLLIAFKSGAARGRFQVTIQVEKPSGEAGPQVKLPVHFEGEDRGVNIVLPTLFEADMEGLYWFDVNFSGTRVTRMPLRVVYQPQPQPGPPLGGA